MTPTTNKGDDAMTQLNWFFTNMWDESYGVAIDASNIWLTSNLGASWTRKQNPTTTNGRVLSPRYLFCVPADKNIVFFTGSRAHGGAAGYALPCFTPDFGATLIDISLPGQPDGIDAVMGLKHVDNLNDSTIFVDYYKV
jgi:hypothetical protein